MSHTSEQRPKLLARVRRIRGQVHSLEQMLTEDHACLDVLQQIAAVRGAVNGLLTQVLEGHVRSHLAAPDLTPAQRAEEAEAVLQALRSYLK